MVSAESERSVWLRTMMLAWCALTALACAPEPRYEVDLRDSPSVWMDSEGRAQRMPEAFEGKTVLINYVYTSCPDVCPISTSILHRVRAALADSTGSYAFATITFDPERDDTEAMADYKAAFEIVGDDWHFLTADTATVNSFLSLVGVRVRPGSELGMIDHTDQISLMDPDGRIRYHYPGSRSSVNMLIQDMQSID